MNSAKKSRWGKLVWLLYGGFLIFVLACVAVVAIQRVDLVEPDYYEKGLDYQTQIKRLEASFENKPELSLSNSDGSLRITFPSYNTIDSISGVILFYRPSDARLDFAIALDPDSSGSQVITDSRLIKGYWRLKISWRHQLKELYSDYKLFVN